MNVLIQKMAEPYEAGNDYPAGEWEITGLIGASGEPMSIEGFPTYADAAEYAANLR